MYHAFAITVLISKTWMLIKFNLCVSIMFRRGSDASDNSNVFTCTFYGSPKYTKKESPTKYTVGMWGHIRSRCLKDTNKHLKTYKDDIQYTSMIERSMSGK